MTVQQQCSRFIKNASFNSLWMIQGDGTVHKGLEKKAPLSCVLLDQVSTVSSLLFHSLDTNSLLGSGSTGVTAQTGVTA